MTEIAEKALTVLQSFNDKTDFSNSDLTSNGFTENEAKLAIKELETNGYIVIRTTYISGNSSFKLI